MSSAPVLAVISKTRMVPKLEAVIEQLRSLHGMAVDKSARKNLKRALISTQNALKVYEHHNLLKPHTELRQRKVPNPQKAKYPWHG